MEFLLSLGFVTVAAICVIVPGSLLAIATIFFIIKRQLKTTSERKELLLTGVTDPATIISARNNYASGSRGRYSRANVTFEVQVLPAVQAPFKATFTDWLPIKRDERFWMGERSGEAGRKVWVTYDPNNRNRMVLDHYDENHEFAMKRKELEKVDKRDAAIRKTGESALAIVLEAEELKLENMMEKNYIQATAMRLKVEITPRDGAIYQADTYGMYKSSSLHKYAVGRKVNVKFNPKDRTQVTVINSAEE